MGHAFGVFMAHLGTLHSRRSFRRCLRVGCYAAAFAAPQHIMQKIVQVPADKYD